MNPAPTIPVEMLLATSSARGNSACRGKKSRFRWGFTLLELMIVISVMMILMAVAVPLYQHHVIQAREAVLKQNLETLRKVLEQYRLDKGQSPQSLDDLVTAGYLPKIPVDPMTNKADWVTEPEDTTEAVDPQQTGIGKVHSAATGTSLSEGEYSTW
jgi:general secretion pathway protein G